MTQSTLQSQPAPAAAASAERRHNERRAVCVGAALARRGVPVAAGTTVDLALEGAFIETGVSGVARDDELMLELTIEVDGRKETHHIAATVAYVLDSGIGVNFNGFNPNLTRRLLHLTPRQPDGV